MQVNMLEAKSQLSKLVQAAQKGENVVIAKNGVPVARLLPFHKPGGLKGWGRLKAAAGDVDAAFTAEVDTEIARLMTGDA
ncbi:MAG: type II toxin-antitoxin system prevent-host-death family antitoxin [Betaproteobacteria bacterium]|nr:type II toxin-antitoxin system prevent-host-death family antitoxin [Betaproteobacteria bacterium]